LREKISQEIGKVKLREKRDENTISNTIDQLVRRGFDDNK
jgi:hypothetical protein